MTFKALQALRITQSTKTVQLLILLIFMAVMVNGVLFFHLEQQNELGLQERLKTEKGIILTRKILGSVKDAEMGQRGYLITEKSNYLIPYDNAVSVIDGLQDSLNALIKDEFSITYNIDLKQMNDFIKAKLAEMNQTLLLKKANKENALSTLVNSDEGERLMNSIRVTSNRLLQRFYDHLAEEEKKVSDTLLISEISMTLLSLIVIVGIIILRSKLAQHDKNNLRLFEELEKQNTKLITQQQDLKNLSVDFASRNGELEHFTHIISHDLRGPLNNILALIKILEEEKDAEEDDPAFKMLKNAADGLFHKLDDLIILLRHKQGGVLLKEKINLPSLLAEVKSNYKLDIQNSGTLIETDFSAADEVLFVKIYMQSILQNLISNAIKYRVQGRKNKISLMTDIAENTIRLTISDNGKGIDLEKYGKDIFGLFKTFHTEEDSHGVGLYLVRKQVTEMDGSIDIASQPNQGTTFTITIPTQ
jgi:signal transduction histidine kinase